MFTMLMDFKLQLLLELLGHCNCIIKCQVKLTIFWSIFVSQVRWNVTSYVEKKTLLYTQLFLL